MYSTNIRERNINGLADFSLLVYHFIIYIMRIFYLNNKKV